MANSPTSTEVISALTFKDAQERLKNIAFQHSIAAASMRISSLMDISHTISVARGWWSKLDGSPKYLNIGERISLMHSELSEALEAIRLDRMSEKLNGHFTEEEEEFADLLHRIFDYADARELRLGDAFVAKAAYNLHREDHSLAARQEAGGKKF